MLRAIIFDLYGVLALNGWQAFKSKHLTDKPDIWDEVFKLGRRVDEGSAKYDELIRFTAGATGQSEATVRYQLEHTKANNELLDYIEGTLRPHYKLGILSNASHDDVLERILSPKQMKLFDAVVLSHHVQLTKPDPRMYQAVADRLGEAVGDCLFVDDQPRHSIGASGVGMRTLVYTDFNKFLIDMESAIGDMV